MTAEFAASLCGYRLDGGKPNTSDAGDAGSVKWGIALFERLGVEPDTKIAKSVDTGALLESRAFEQLSCIRADVQFHRSASIDEFEQYQHLRAFVDFQRDYRVPSSTLVEEVAAIATASSPRDRRRLDRLLQKAQTESTSNESVIDRLRREMAQESVLNVDLAVAENRLPSAESRRRPRLLIALSSKWSLRTDRAQDCVAQGQKLANLRRGHMPHFAVLTIEPRPTMLRLLAYGSGAIDCVYHIALPELILAANDLVDRATTRTRTTAIRQRESLQLMIAQRRVRPFSELVTEVSRLAAT